MENYKEGNHGWSSDFKAVSVNDFAELMIKNWAKDFVYESGVNVSDDGTCIRSSLWVKF